jgi:hypothetical protein
MPLDPSMKRLDDRPVPDIPGEIRAFLTVRDEALRLPDNLRHHRERRVGRFFIVDNGSTDGTVEFLLQQPDVHLFSTQASFAASGFGMAWLNPLLDQYGDGHWTLTVDADELLVYPGFETVALPRVCRHLDALGAQAVFCLLLDMYADAPLGGIGYASGQSLLQTCPWFDRAPYRAVPAGLFPNVQMYGGMRERVFGFSGAPHPPTISKVPLVRWTTGMRFLLCTHALSPVRLAQMTGALLHFKFLDDFHARVDKEVLRGEHIGGAAEYRVYAEILRRGGALNLRNQQSVSFRDSRQLVEFGLMGL